MNPDVKKVGITPMEGKTTKRKAQPQPSKPVETKALLGGGKEQQPTEPKVSDKLSSETAHENNKIFLISGLVLRRLRSVTLFLHKAFKEEGGNRED